MDPLWQHQVDAIDSARKALVSNDRILISMACGTGKTRVGYELGSLFGPQVAILVPTLALIEQTRRAWIDLGYRSDSILAVCGDDSLTKDPLVTHVDDLDFPVTSNAEAIKAFTESGSKPLVLCTYQSISALIRSCATFDLVIYDEAHHIAGYQHKAFSESLTIPSHRKIFLTATPRVFPLQSDCNSMDDIRVFGPRVFNYDIRDAIVDGILTDYRVIIATKDNKGSLGMPSVVQAKILQTCLRHVGATRAISFHNRISNASNHAAALRDIGIEADVVSSHRPRAKRREIIHAFRREGCVGLRVLTNARCLSEGVDIPAVDAVAIMEPRSSPIEILQILGRALRKAPGKRLAYLVLPVLLWSHGLDDTKDALEKSPYRSTWNFIRALAQSDPEFAKSVYSKDGISFTGRNRVHVLKYSDSDRKLIPVEKSDSILLGQRTSIQLGAFCINPNQSDLKNIWEHAYRSYIHEHDDEPIRIHHQQGGIELGAWVHRARTAREAMSEEDRTWFESLPHWRWEAPTESFMTGIDLLRRRLIISGLPLRGPLSDFVSACRDRHRAGELSVKEESLLRKYAPTVIRDNGSKTESARHSNSINSVSEY